MVPCDGLLGLAQLRETDRPPRRGVVGDPAGLRAGRPVALSIDFRSNHRRQPGRAEGGDARGPSSVSRRASGFFHQV
jgi:hypothetical protein